MITQRFGHPGYPCSIPDKGKIFFSSPNVLIPHVNHSLLFIGRRALLPRVVKWPGPEVHHSPSFTADVRNEWSYTSALLYAFMVWSATVLASVFA